MNFLFSSITINALALIFFPKYFNRDNRLKEIGISLAKILTRFGPAFIKLGQMLSIRPDIVGDIISFELKYLQDKVPLRGRESEKFLLHFLKKIGLENNGGFIDSSSASIAEVYRISHTKVGNIALKILKKNSKRKFLQNLSLLKLIMICARLIFRINIYKLDQIINVMVQSARIEFNMSLEGAVAEKMRNSFLVKNLEIKIPAIMWEYSSNEVLVMEWINGTSLKNIQFDNLQDAEVIAKKLIDFSLSQLYIDGFFHADMHPGNIFISHKKKIVILDFGLVGFIEEGERIILGRILKAFLEENYDEVAKLHHDAGYFYGDSVEIFALACHSIGASVTNADKKGRLATMLKNLLNLIDEFKINLRPHLILLHKTMITLEGVVNQMHEDIDAFILIKNWFIINGKEFERSYFEDLIPTKAMIKKIMSMMKL